MAGLSITRVWNETKDVIARERRLLLPLVMLFIALPVTLVGLIAPSQSLLKPTEGGVAESLLSLAVALISIAASLAVTRIALGFAGSLGEAIREGFKRMWTLLGGAILVVLILVVPITLILFVLIATGVVPADRNPADPANMPPGMALFVLLIVIGAIIVGVRLLMMNPAVMAEKIGPWALVKRSVALTRGHFWRLLATMLLLVIGFLVAAAALGAVVGGLAVAILGKPDPMTLSALLVALVGGVLQAIYGIVAATMIARIYVQLAGQSRTDEPAA